MFCSPLFSWGSGYFTVFTSTWWLLWPNFVGNWGAISQSTSSMCWPGKWLSHVTKEVETSQIHGKLDGQGKHKPDCQTFWPYVWLVHTLYSIVYFCFTFRTAWRKKVRCYLPFVFLRFLFQHDLFTFLWDKNSFSSRPLAVVKQKVPPWGGQNGYLLDRDRILFTGMFRVGFVRIRSDQWVISPSKWLE